jgi:aminoglycoside phosphotransferase (APT) family kinase protein
MELLIEFLPKNVPYEDTVSITHGDYRIENVMFHPTEPRIIAVLDRELSTIGSPLADIAYNCLLWHSTSERWGALQGVDFSSSGIPSEFAYRQAYCQRTNRKMITHWSFYLAFSLFRLAAISQGVYKRILDGNASTNRPAINETKNRAQQAWRFIESDVV